MNKRQVFGKTGEGKARKFLEHKGYRIVDQNYRNALGEVDLICKDHDTLVFVEVKARKSREFGDGAEAVNHKKREKLIKMAYSYLKVNNLEAAPFRFDVISIVSGNPEEISHVVGAFP